MLERPHEYYGVEGGRLSASGTLPDQQQAFYRDRQGRLWTSDEADRITLWKDGQPETLPLQELQRSAPSTSRTKPEAAAVGAPPQSVTWNRLVFEDREGNIWLGTYDKGLLGWSNKSCPLSNSRAVRGTLRLPMMKTAPVTTG